ncbi:MAG: DUF1028 domain-containing protein [Gemmataceae bacterium]|nr:DUF1028 domain-containing protein [Gemmataceae bacterium]
MVACTRLVVIAAAVVGLASGVAIRASDDPIRTFSIVAYDPVAKEWGVAVASKYLAVGAVVPWAKAGVGAVATQSYANVSFGPNGLELMAKNRSATETLRLLIDADPGAPLRQVGMVGPHGDATSFTGNKCNPWAGGIVGKHYACQGNLLAGEAVVEAMATTFESSKGPLAWKLMHALDAGDKAGGDKRGKQSAALLVVRAKGGLGGLNDRYLDYRVDDHPDPVPELARILALRVKRPGS